MNQTRQEKRPTTLPQLWDELVRTRGTHEFLVFEDAYSHAQSRLTYAQCDARANQYAQVLAAQGVQRGTQVALYLENSSEFVECLLGLAKLGAVAVPIDASSTPHELVRIIGLSEVTTLILGQTQLAQVSGELQGSSLNILCIVEGGDSLPTLDIPVTDLSALVAQSPTTPPQVHGQTTATDLAMILFTSGTTSAPKGVMITQANMILSGEYVNWELAMTSEDRYLTSMVVARVNFLLNALLPVLTSGSTLILLSAYSARSFWKQIQRHEATLAQGMAMIVATLLRQPVAENERAHKLREMHYFLPLNNHEKGAFEERFGVTLLNNYGSTESLVGVITDPPTGPRKWPSIGKIGPGYGLKILTDDGRIATDGQIGEIYIHGIPGETLMAGYWNNPQATAEVLSDDGWYRTYDYGYSIDGWVYFADRRTDLIKRSGESVSSAEVEGAITDMAGIREAAVIGVPDEVRGQEIHAFVVAEDGYTVTKEDVITHCTHRLAAFKVPSAVTFIDELPRGSYGKVDKKTLSSL